MWPKGSTPECSKNRGCREQHDTNNGFGRMPALFGRGFSGPRGGYPETTIKSDADDEKLKQLVDAVEAHCPILDTLARRINVSGGVTPPQKRANHPDMVMRFRTVLDDSTIVRGTIRPGVVVGETVSSFSLFRRRP